MARPRPWNIDEIRRFILFIGPISSIFDYTTFFVMLWIFHCWDPSRASVFQTGWFVESLMTQTLIIHVIRTNRIPFIAEPGQLAADGHLVVHHGLRRVASVFPAGSGAGALALAGAVLADPDGDTARLHGSHADDQSVAAAETLDLIAHRAFAQQQKRGPPPPIERREAAPDLRPEFSV